jgi:hypothetical protein
MIKVKNPRIIRIPLLYDMKVFEKEQAVEAYGEGQNGVLDSLHMCYISKGKAGSRAQKGFLEWERSVSGVEMR